MRYIYKKIDPKVGDKRIVVKFAFFPITIGEESRRWEWVMIEQTRYGCSHGDYTCCPFWRNERFIDSIPPIGE